jgi:hypothetical protein
MRHTQHSRVPRMTVLLTLLTLKLTPCGSSPVPSSQAPTMGLSPLHVDRTLVLLQPINRHDEDAPAAYATAYV